MEDVSSNSCGGSSTLQYRSGPQIQFPPPPKMQFSSAYECYANVIVPKKRTAFDMTTESLNGYHDISIEPILKAQPEKIEYLQPHDQYFYDQYTDNSTQERQQSVNLPCYECIEMQNMSLYYAPNKIRDDYDIYSQRRHLERFGLSKKGLLQIDYSLSWMNLQRLISNK